MKVDMSPEAVTRRLRIMDELWQLSMKLMNAKRVGDADRHEETEEGDEKNLANRSMESGHNI
jgi:hypothetical protein